MEGVPDGDRITQVREAVIMAADAVGYSRAMSSDETAALAALAASRRIFDQAIGRHGGRRFAAAGDSVLAEFAASAQAVRCAVDAQRALAQADRPVLTFRIGVHRGRVHDDDGDLLGDAVNIAARLESLANPGGLLISAEVRRDLASTDGLDLEELGPRLLKNIRQPVGVVRVRLGEPAAERGLRERRFSIAVLPFAARAGSDLDYLAEGLADDLIAGLARFRSLAVLARSSTFGYDAAAVDPRRLAADLGVNFVVSGSVAGAGDRLRIAARLNDANTGRTLWADRVDVPSDDVFAAQDRIVETVVATVAGRIEEAGTEAARRQRPDSPAAFDLVLQAIYYAHRTDRDSNRAALDCLQRAVALEPDYALAQAWLALMMLRRWAFESNDRSRLGPVAEAAARALALDPAESWCHLVAGQVAMYQGDLAGAEVQHKKASALNPYDAHVMALRAPLAVYLGKPEEGMGWIERALALNPHPPAWYATNLGLAAYCAHRYAAAIEAYAGVVAPQMGALAGLAAALAQAGDPAGAARAAARVLSSEPKFASAVFVSMRPFKFSADADHLLDGLRKAGLP